MSAERDPFWEAAYRDPDADPFGPPSEEVVRLASRLPAGARALDLGCGDGRNALCLARYRIRVDAVDRSVGGVEKLQARARRSGSKVHASVQDLTTFRFKRSYELVVAHGVLHLLDRPAWRRLLRAMRHHTVPGGWNIVAVFTDRLPPPADLAAHMRGLFREEELLEQYEGWMIEVWNAYTLQDEHPGGIRHRHPINEIVARKPERP